MSSTDSTNLSGNADRDEIQRLRAEYASAVRALHSSILATTRLTRLFSVLSEPAPLPQLLDRVLSTLSELFMADVVVLFELLESGQFSPIASVGWPRPAGGVVAVSDEFAARALESRTAAVIRGIPGNANVPAYLRDQGAESAAWFAVAGDDAVRGVLVLARCRPGEFARAEIDLLRSMAYRLGLILDRAHADRQERELEQRLRRAEKAESLARMAGAIAHHFNNLLTVVIGNLDLLASDLPRDFERREDLDRAKDAARRAAKMSGLMLAYLGVAEGARELVNVDHLIGSALEKVRDSLPANVLLGADICDADLVVSVAVPPVVQGLVNLIINAEEAIGTRPGRVRLRARAMAGEKLPVGQLQPGAKPSAGMYVCIEVEDTGTGMTPDVIDKIFDPFFSTKFVGRGLGLPVLLGTVRAHDGFMAVQSTPGVGTRMRVYLPLATRAALPATVSSEAGKSPANGPVLIADDDDLVRVTAERTLVKLGYAVITAADGVQAVELFRNRSSEISLAILDVLMPRLDGCATLAAMRATRPDLPVILVSGYDESDLPCRDAPVQPTLVLHKPYTIEQLRAALAKAQGNTP